MRQSPTRGHYVHFETMTTRWRDNDVYAHMNNATYYEYVDTAVNGWLARSGALDVPGGPVIGLVAETGCRFHAPLGFPAPVEAGLAVAHLGRSSVVYRVGLFAESVDAAAADARFVHVYVDRDTRRPVPLPDRLRDALTGLLRMDWPD
ncbi:acyl-CoA thioesterase [Oceanomicrobium pacificus]|uniref:Acyl-CoA thioesterase n=1 Tax=Oceanomicrobium pacificus TaxID=2692916 RepID=A0A6B0TMP6_9RHOB|nr:thioesterase family protein [Oceanomicrobium pacificus]MXU63849.1 acyl-CoA thioesterase [Oceanomicrobium pacificus]